jgi:hypothetical protein
MILAISKIVTNQVTPYTVDEFDDSWTAKIQPSIPIKDYSFDRSKIARHLACMNSIVETDTGTVSRINRLFARFVGGVYIQKFLDEYFFFFEYFGDDFHDLIRRLTVVTDVDLRAIFLAIGRLATFVDDSDE